MTAASLIAAPDGRGQLIDDCVHPQRLWEILRRDGVDLTIARLIDVEHGWAYLDAHQPAELHPAHCNERGVLVAVVGYGVARLDLAPVDTNDRSDERSVHVAFVLDRRMLRVRAHDLALTVPYADPAPNWSQFDHIVLGGPPPTLHLVASIDHPSRGR